MTLSVYSQPTAHTDYHADRWCTLQGHILGLHDFLSSSVPSPQPLRARPEALVEPALLASERRRLLDCYLAQVVAQSRTLSLRMPAAPAELLLPISTSSAYVTLQLAATSAGDAPMSVCAGLREHRHLILIGPDGSGKSTTINYIAATMAAAIREPEQPVALQRQLEGWQRGPRLPVCVRLAAAVAAAPASDNPLDALWAGVPELALLDLAPREQLLLRDTLAHTLERGQGILMIDGLEQVPSGPDLDRANALIEAARHRFGASHILITYRSDDYSCPAYRMSEIESAVLAPLTLGQIDLFIARWYRAYTALGRYTTEAAQERARKLSTLMRREPALRAFAASPHNLATVLLVHSDQDEMPPAIIKSFWAQIYSPTSSI